MKYIRRDVLIPLLFLFSATGFSEEVLDNWGELQGSKITLPTLIQLISEKEVFNWGGESSEEIRAAAQSVVDLVSAAPIAADRINEVGNTVEDLVMAELLKQGFESGRPRTESGRNKSAGYPDLYASNEAGFYYIEIKTYSSNTINSTLRTFYISPSEDFKVSRNGFHLLLAFSTEEIEKGVYSLTGYKLLDLYTLECKLKLEFNASNRDLYGDDAGLDVLDR